MYYMSVLLNQIGFDAERANYMSLVGGYVHISERRIYLIALPQGSIVTGHLACHIPHGDLWTKILGHHHVTWLLRRLDSHWHQLPHIN
jgi:hypothetical protein